jgi:hypothetical protein
MSFFTSPVYCQEKPVSQVTAGQELALIKAVMCEKIENYAPVNPAIVFSTSLEGVTCFTLFDPVPKKGVVYHNWYFRDKLTTRFKLSLQPPRWATFSSIHLREADRGPWRVEITDEKGDNFSVLRFSITD